MSLKKEKGKAYKIAEAIKAEISSGKIRSGNRIKGVRELAAQFSGSINAAQRAMDALEADGLIERRQGSGTFVKGDNKSSRSNTVYVLVPHPFHIKTINESSVMLNQILYGITSAPLSKLLPQLVPVAKQNIPSITKPSIDWENLEQIPSGANVFVSAMWYNKIFPFLVERGVKGILLAAQYERERQQMYDLVKEAAWSFVTIDRFTGIQKVVEYLHSTGRRRIAAIKHFREQPEHPFMRGFITGYGNCNMDFRSDFFQEIDQEITESKLKDIISDLHGKTKFDALIICNPDAVRPAYSALSALGFRIPDDVAVIAFRDMPEYINFTPSLSAFDFPWSDIGREVARLFASEDPFYKNTHFHSSIIERYSTRKDRYTSTTDSFIAELSYTKDIMV